MPIKKVLDERTKGKIDAMSYESMLRLNRFSPSNEPLFMGVAGVYFFEIMSLKKIEVGNAGHVQASKNIGWNAP